MSFSDLVNFQLNKDCIIWLATGSWPRMPWPPPLPCAPSLSSKHQLWTDSQQAQSTDLWPAIPCQRERGRAGRVGGDQFNFLFVSGHYLPYTTPPTPAGFVLLTSCAKKRTREWRDPKYTKVILSFRVQRSRPETWCRHATPDQYHDLSPRLSGDFTSTAVGWLWPFSSGPTPDRLISSSSGGFQMYCSPLPMKTASCWPEEEHSGQTY